MRFVSPPPHLCRFNCFILKSIDMVYTSPMKVARIVTWDKQGIPHQDIANDIGIHRTTIARILACFEKSADFYHVNPKTGRPRKFEE